MDPLIVMQFDMRSSPECPDSQSERYRACIDMVRWADQQNISVVGFSEHHNTEDGFLSSPLMMAMAAVTNTARISVSVSALLLPLHNPIRIAEDIAVLDLASGGRFMAILGLGYREAEYRAMGVEWDRRGKILDEKLTVILAAWKGKPFEYNGTTLYLNPVPERSPQNLLCIGGNSPAAARRAAKFKLMFAPPIDDPALQDIYQAQCAQQGFEQGAVIFPNKPSLTFIAEDPDKDWREMGKYLLYDALAYRRWQHKTRRAYAESYADNLHDLREEGKYSIITPRQAIAEIEQKGSLNLAPLCGGMPIAYGWKSLELYANKVAPHFSQ